MDFFGSFQEELRYIHVHACTCNRFQMVIQEFIKSYSPEKSAQLRGKFFRKISRTDLLLGMKRWI